MRNRFSNLTHLLTDIKKNHIPVTLLQGAGGGAEIWDLTERTGSEHIQRIKC